MAKKKTLNISFDLKFTLTSFAGYFILIVGMISGIVIKDKQLIGDSMLYGSALLGARKLGNSFSNNSKSTTK